MPNQGNQRRPKTAPCQRTPLAKPEAHPTPRRRPPEESGRLLATLATRRLPSNDSRVHVLPNRLLGDNHLRDIRPRRNVVHNRLQDFLHDRPQPTSASPTKDRLVSHSLKRRVRELQLYTVHLEQLLVLLHQRIPWRGKNLHKRSLVKIGHGSHNRQPPNELGNQPELDQVLRHRVGEEVRSVDLRLGPDLGTKAKPTLPDPVLNDLVQPSERSSHDEQHVRRVDLDELLVRVLTPALRRHGSGSPLEDLQQSLLHTLTRHIP